MPRGFAHRFVILRERSDALRTALLFCASVATLCAPLCHSERSEESFQ